MALVRQKAEPEIREAAATSLAAEAGRIKTEYLDRAGNGAAGNGLPQFKGLSLSTYEVDAQKQCRTGKVVRAAAPRKWCEPEKDGRILCLHGLRRIRLPREGGPGAPPERGLA